MRIGVPKETAPGETRVAAVPETVARFVKMGLEVVLEPGAGQAAGYPDSEYLAKGARLAAAPGEALESDIVLKVRAPSAAESRRLKPGAVLIALLNPLADAECVARLAGARVTALALELVPRTTRAQSMDVLSSQANIAGYKAVLAAAGTLPRLFPMLMTAAGTIRPATVLILGAGVAGLQAIATAKRLGGVVYAYDVRAAVKEQVQSLGARFVELDTGTKDAEGAGGYAKQLAADEQVRQREALAKHVAQADVVICTALIPGRKAPLLVTADAVKAMKPGSVVVDLAAGAGGNCELSEADRIVVKHGVTIVGMSNLPATVPYHASQTYAKNIENLVTEFWKDGKLVLDPADEIVAGVTVTRDGEVVHPAVKPLLATAKVSS